MTHSESRLLRSAFIRLLTSMFFCGSACAALIPIGYLSYDVTLPGVSVEFDVTNQTGPNSSLFPDPTWPVVSSVPLSIAAFTVNFSDGSNQSLSPGYFTLGSDGLSWFGDSIDISGNKPQPTFASLTGTFGMLTITLNDGSGTFIAPSSFTNAKGSAAPTVVDPAGTCSVPGAGCLQDGDLAVIYANAVPEPAMGPLLAAVFLAAASISVPARLLSKRHFVLICSVLAACSYPLCQGAWTNAGDSCSPVKPAAASPWDDQWIQVAANQDRGKKVANTPDWSIPAADATAAVRETPHYPLIGSTGPFAEEGPYCQTAAQYASFRLTIQYQVITGRVHPKFVVNDAVLTPPSDNNASTDQDFGNSGIYIFDRWEVQIIDPSQFDDSNNKKAYGGGVPQGKTILADPYIGARIDPVKKTRSQSNPTTDNQRNVNVPSALYQVNPINKALAGDALYINQANPAEQWNSLDITFCAPTLTDDKMGIKMPPMLSSKLNGQTVYYGTVAGKGTGSRGSLKPLAQGPIYLQSHWGSQVQFRMPMITVIDTSKNACALP